MFGSNKKNAILIGVVVVLLIGAGVAFFWNGKSGAGAPPSPADEQAAAAVSAAVHADQAPIDNSPPTAPRGSGRLAGGAKK